LRSAAAELANVVPNWICFAFKVEAMMPVNLSIKNAPDDVVERLRTRAARNHRSLQGELLAIIEDATRSEHKITLHEVMERNRALGLSTPDEATQWIREDRDR
jgi:plasmid stability protein